MAENSDTSATSADLQDASLDTGSGTTQKTLRRDKGRRIYFTSHTFCAFERSIINTQTCHGSLLTSHDPLFDMQILIADQSSGVARPGRQLRP